MERGLNRNYVAFRLRKSSYSSGSAASMPEIASSSETVSLRPSADVTELLTFGSGTFYKKVIKAIFAKKETLKKIPVIGPLAVNIKRKMASNRSGELRFDDIISLPRRRFVAELYRRALGREADYHDLRNYDLLGFMGMNNLATVYLVCTSPEFGSRVSVANINVYKKAYRRFRIKSFIFNFPILGYIASLFTLPSTIRMLADKFSEFEFQLDAHEYNSAHRASRSRQELDGHEYNSASRDYRMRQELEKYSSELFLQSSAAKHGLSLPPKTLQAQNLYSLRRVRRRRK